MSPAPRVLRETCAWPGCGKAISWKQAWCHPHWKRIPEEERRERTAEVFAARAAAAAGEDTVSTGESPTETEDASGWNVET